nr:alpha-soluble NSF attachment protein [Ipomoea batatas]GMD35158.1 alpha-soluble NSF attachment protein [Ipomoea batatas]
MVRGPSVDKNGLKKGAWSEEEDDKLRAYVLRYGHWNWRQLPKFAVISADDECFFFFGIFKACRDAVKVSISPFCSPQSKMGDQVARGEEFEKKLSGWALFSSKYEDAADFFEKAANCFKLAKSWDQAGATYVKLANCHLKLDSKHEAASAFADAGHNYKKTNTREAVSCLEQAVNLFLENGRLNMSARYYKEIAEIYEQEQNLEQAIAYYEKAADLIFS